MKRRAWLVGSAALFALLAVPTHAIAGETRAVSSGPIRDAGISLRYPSNWKDVTKKVLSHKDSDVDTRRTRFIAGYQGEYVTGLVSVKVRPLNIPFYRDLDEFRHQYASVYYAEPGRDPADYALFSNHSERTQRIGKRTAYRVDATMKLEFEDGATKGLRFAELWIPRTAHSAVFVRVQAEAGDAGQEIIDSVMASIRPV